MARQCPPGTTSYTIKAGDTFYRLAQRFNTTVAAMISANPTVNPDQLRIGQVICLPARQPAFPPCPEGNYYTIQAGDSLFAIARRFNVSLDDLLEANPLVDPNRLQIGQIICIPVATPPVTCPAGAFTYTIQAGDTIYNLAQRFRVSVDSILRLNPRINPNSLLIGQKICLPQPI